MSDSEHSTVTYTSVSEDDSDIDSPGVDGPPIMIRMLQVIDREDLETLWKLVKEKHGINKPIDEYERVLWGDLKVMFEPDIKNDVWRNLQGYKVTVWKLFDNYGIQKINIKFRGGLLGLKDVKIILRVTTAGRINAVRDEIKDISKKR
ncbi:hypothetical protein Tco_1223733 [Tanacetum coccineum]